VRTPSGYRTIRGRNVVFALGSYSAPFLRAYGVRLNIYPAKGYSWTTASGSGHRIAQMIADDDGPIVA
jgi:D-amino-acid dehydrogenase